MFDAQRLLGQVLKDSLGGGRRQRRRSLTGLPGGMEAKLGVGLLGLAIAAFEHFRAPGSAPAATAAGLQPLPPAGSPPPPPPGRPSASPSQANHLHLLRLMIAAMHADGAVDTQERGRLLQRAADAGLQAEDMAALEAELWHPRPLAELVRDTPADLREQAWIAALVAIDVDEASEHAFLAQLADGLGLDAGQQARIRDTIGLPPSA